jgi:putative pyruvate formate lyase activating enzyme
LDTFANINFEEISQYLGNLKNCSFCPRNCNSDRFSENTGYCRTDSFFNISSICIHKGEEPVISGDNGICNIFFSRCNIQCVYCQNYQISRNSGEVLNHRHELREILEQIVAILDTGVEAVGFVSPSHNIPQVIVIIKALKKIGRNPIIVFNTGGYDKVSSIQLLNGLVDVYLPDFKYMDDSLAVSLSDAPFYSKYASKAIGEMYRQKGSTILTNANNYAESGLIIRHLVLPGYVENSISVLQYIAQEISVNVHLSLMSQYYPNDFVTEHPNLKRTISANEYKTVIREMERLGFSKGWIQEPNSSEFYQPDFLLKHPFEQK